MNLAIVGSRTFYNYEFLKNEIDKYLIENKSIITNIISGGAKGADSLAERYAKEHNINTIILYANWDLCGKSAGYLRNVQIVDISDIIMAFWDGKSKGTNHTINLAKEKNKKVVVINF